jgi:hypothetical protein
MTPIRPLLTQDSRQQFRRDCGTVGATLLLLAALSAVGYALQTDAAEPMPAAERAMLASCRLPDQDGAATVYARVDGKIFCWRMK